MKINWFMSARVNFAFVVNKLLLSSYGGSLLLVHKILSDVNWSRLLWKEGWCFIIYYLIPFQKPAKKGRSVFFSFGRHFEELKQITVFEQYACKGCYSSTLWICFYWSQPRVYISFPSVPGWDNRYRLPQHFIGKKQTWMETWNL